MVENAITPVVTHAMMLMAFVLFLALKYLQANLKYTGCYIKIRWVLCPYPNLFF